MDVLQVKINGQWYAIPALNNGTDWSSIEDKPFSQIGDGLKVQLGVLSVDNSALLSRLDELEQRIENLEK